MLLGGISKNTLVGYAILNFRLLLLKYIHWSMVIDGYFSSEKVGSNPLT